MARKGGLGKGLDALIPGNVPENGEGGVTYAPIANVVPNPRQPRQAMKEAELQELAASILEHGILQPLLVTLEPTSGHYILIAGERRLRAAHLAGLDSVPVLVRQVTDQQRLELALIENVQRADLTPLETAEAYRQLHDEFDLTEEEIAARVGKNRSTISNTLRLLKLTEAIHRALAEGHITEGHARALLGLEDYPELQNMALKNVLAQNLNVRQTEAMVKDLRGERPQRQPKPAPAAEIQDVEERLRRYLGTRLKLLHGKKGGSLTIYYFSDEELNTIITRILKE